MTDVQLVWGCERSRQLEIDWLRSLFRSFRLYECDAGDGASVNTCFCVLVESGLLRLESRVSAERLDQQHHLRLKRLQMYQPDLLLHISDEEGLDAESFYALLPPDLPVWRNFHHPRLSDLHRHIRHFPIGPRAEFLVPNQLKRASCRAWPWAFMGTLWPTGNRTLAASLFLRALPTGQFHGGRHFGQGVPLSTYRLNLADSVFALCPEGDRHFDTFRLYESLQLGCLPLVVERQQQARTLLGQGFPLPIFPDWLAALRFVQKHLNDPAQTDALQQQVLHWWEQVKERLSFRICQDLSGNPGK